MADLTDLQAAETVKIVGSNSSGVETNSVNADVNGNLQTKDYADGTSGSAVPSVTMQVGGSDGTNLRTIKTDTSGSQVVIGDGTPGTPTSGVLTVQYAEPYTYSACADGFAVATTPTDVFTITGSASKTIRVNKIRVSGTTTSGSAIKLKISLIKRSTVDSGGTRVADTVVPNDSTNAAGTATVGHYTANPTLGTSVGAVRTVSLGITNQGLVGGEVDWSFTNESSQQPLFLRGTSEQLCINFGSITIAGSIISIVAEWTEI